MRCTQIMSKYGSPLSGAGQKQHCYDCNLIIKVQ